MPLRDHFRPPLTLKHSWDMLHGMFNLYADLLELLGQSDPALEPSPPSVYAVTLRWRKIRHKRRLLVTWHYPLSLGQALPTLPLWLNADLAVPLELEATYEDACRVLRIR